MKVVYHPDFPKDIRKYRHKYDEVSVGLGSRFMHEIDTGIECIKCSPTSAGHFLNTGSAIITEFRRINLASFPFFILYAVHVDAAIVGALIPTASDPLTWLSRFTN